MRIVELKEEAIITDEELCTILEGPELDVDNLQHLNLSFNKIQSLNGIEKFTTLKLLNVSENKIKSLLGVETLVSLQFLKCCYNAISDLTPLQKCTQLEELWIRSNNISSEAVPVFKSLENLNLLLIQSNPICKMPGFELLLTGFAPQLQRIDTTIVSHSFRQRASDFIRRDSQARLLMMKHGRVKAKAFVDQFPVQTADEVANSPLRSKEKKKSTTKAFMDQFPVQSPSLEVAESPKEKFKAFMDQFPTQSFLPEISNCNSTNQCAPPMRLSILDAVSGLPDLLNPKKAKEFRKKKNLRPKRPPKPSKKTVENYDGPKRTETPDEILSQDPICLSYLNDRPAVEIRSDGSGFAKWSNGRIAVAVDKEPNGYRIYAADGTGRVLVSLDSQKVGFINYPTGRTMFSTNRDGTGMFLSETGQIIADWDMSNNRIPKYLSKKIAIGTGLVAVVQVEERIGLNIQVYFDHLNIQRRFVHGPNLSHETNPIDFNLIFGKKKSATRKPPAQRLSHTELVERIQASTNNL